MAGRRALITGIDGQDGSYLAEQLVEEGCDIVGLARPPLDRAMANLGAVRGRISLVPGDLLDPRSLAAAVREGQRERQAHAAASDDGDVVFHRVARG